MYLVGERQVLTVQQGTFSVVGITPVPASTITAPTGSFSLVSAVEVIAQPAGYTGSLGPAAVPLEISVPLPAGVTDTEFIVGEQVVIDSISGTPGLRPQFLPRAMAVAVGGNIATHPAEPAEGDPARRCPCHPRSRRQRRC